MVENKIIAAAKFGEPRPVVPAVFRDEDYAGTRSQENPARVVRIIGQAADIAAIRPQYGPWATLRPNRIYRSQQQNHQRLQPNRFHRGFVPTNREY